MGSKKTSGKRARQGGGGHTPAAKRAAPGAGDAVTPAPFDPAPRPDGGRTTTSGARRPPSAAPGSVDDGLRTVRPRPLHIDDKVGEEGWGWRAGMKAADARRRGGRFFMVLFSSLTSPLPLLFSFASSGRTTTPP
jgi:hypothetical protein